MSDSQNVEVGTPFPFIITDKAITLIANGKNFTVPNSHANYSAIIEAIKARNWTSAIELADIKAAIEKYADGVIEIEDEVVYYVDNGTREACHGFVVDKILEFMREGLDFKPLVNFLVKVYSNPSKHVVDQLFTFLSHHNMPIGPDGNFFGYKAVRNDFMDKHTGSIFNGIGAEPTMKRNSVDDRSEVGCSKGLHVGSLQYVQSFANGYGQPNGDKIVIVSVNPADVVTVPSEDTTKLRCCKYKVTSEFTGVLPETFWDGSSSVIDDEDYDVDDFEEDEDWDNTTDNDWWKKETW